MSLDIVLSTYPTSCIDIEANNVVFDCVGHSIRGPGAQWAGTNLIAVGGNFSVVKNCVLSDSGRGVATVGFSHDNLILNNTIYNMWEGINAAGNYQTVENNTVYNNRVAEGRAFTIWWNDIYGPTGHIVRGNAFTDSNYGIDLGYCFGPIPFPCLTGHSFYNNYVAGNTVNARDFAGYNSWNVTKTPGTNILGGPFLGGNFWNDYGGADTDGDGLGDTMLPYTAGGNIANGGDSAPLTGCVSPPANLVSWWPGDGNANDIIDNNNGILQNGATFATGKVGQAFSFDGIDDYVDVGAGSNLNLDGRSFTLMAWVNLPSLIANDNRMFLTKGNTATASQLLHFGKGFGPSWTFALYGSGLLIPSDIQAGVWYHVVGTYNATTKEMKLYVDGNLIGQGIASSDLTNTDSFPLLIGRRQSNVDGGGDMFWHGLIDETALFGRTLSASEIQAIFNAGMLGKCKIPSTPFDFSMSNSGDMSIFQGGSGSNTITASLLSGTSQSVVLSCASGLPLGASCSFSTNPLLPSSSADLLIATSTSTPPGSFPITVTGTGGGWIRTTQFVLVMVSGSGGGSSWSRYLT